MSSHIVLHSNLPYVVDQCDDNGAVLADGSETLRTKLASAVAHSVGLANSARRSSEDYALVCTTPAGPRYKYPMHDAASTVLSANYLVKVAHTLPDKAVRVAAKNLSTRLREYGVDAPEDLTALEVYKSAQVNTLPDEVLFANEVASVSPKDRRALAVIAKEKLASVPECLLPYSGDKLSHKFYVQIAARERLLSGDDRADLVDCYEQLKKYASAGNPLDSVAELLYEADLDTGLIMNYGRGLADAYEAVFSQVGIQKTASVRVGGVLMEEQELADAVKTRSEAIDRLAPGLAEEIAARPAEVYDSLPAPHKAAIARIVNAAG